MITKFVDNYYFISILLYRIIFLLRSLKFKEKREHRTNKSLLESTLYLVNTLLY